MAEVARRPYEAPRIVAERPADLKTLRELAESSDGLWPPEFVLDLLRMVEELTWRLESKQNALTIAVRQRNEAHLLLAKHGLYPF